ncbi:hypothetical protein KAR91_74590 [Candidatus Pacearchaeota archaeon]|nr:hypothetical protein [Candidatus Pacearchaeota archaeon]
MNSIRGGDTESWNDPWEKLVADLAPNLANIHRIENFRIKVETFKNWFHSNFSSLSACEAWRVAEIIRSTFDFERSNRVQESVIRLALAELNLTSQPEKVQVVSNARGRFKLIKN